MQLAVFLALALAAAASAKPYFPGQYAVNQVDAILDRASECLKAVPQRAPFYTPAANCYRPIQGDLRAGVSKETLVESIPHCLNRQVKYDTAKVVSNVQQCLSKSLVEQALPAPVEEAVYTDKQLDEMRSRIDECSTSIREFDAQYCSKQVIRQAERNYGKESLQKIFTDCLVTMRPVIEASIISEAGECLAT